MAGTLYNHDPFDLRLAVECATAYADSTGLGCTVSDTAGSILFERGYGCGSCAVCGAAGLDKAGCVQAHAYGMTEAERFGGKYIYFCPMGLTCFVSPIMGQAGSLAKITVGPFFMVDQEDFVAFDLREKRGLDPAGIQQVMEAAADIPYVSPGRVNALSILLFMAVGFMNNVSAAGRMLDVQDSDAIQGQISEYIRELKGGEVLPQYPIQTEKAMLASIARSDRAKAQEQLNELLGHILFSSGGDFAALKSRMYELLVMISRAAVDAGASPEHTFRTNHRFFLRAQASGNIDDLCMLLTRVMNEYIDSLFEFTHVQRTDVIHKAVQYMRHNCLRKVSLEETAQEVFLSPTYFSKVFKKEMGCSFNTYLNRLRIEKSKQLLLQEDLRLVDIATMAGFEDQSYFTKVFKRMTGVSPNQFRKSGGRIEPPNKTP